MLLLRWVKVVMVLLKLASKVVLLVAVVVLIARGLGRWR